jgi:hypothetical protein
LSPTRAITPGYPVWRRIARLSKRENVGSLADILGACYGKNRSLGIAATLVAGLGTLPCIALQLTVLTSARRPSLTQHNRGLVGMLALESVVKLAGLGAAAGLALLLFARAPAGFATGFAHAMPGGPVPDGAFLTLVTLCTVTAFTLPRQFHLGSSR